jgi:hypothetical protein
MIEQSHSTGRTRPYPLPTVLRAIARTVSAPGGPLPEPHRIDWPHRIRGYDQATTEFPAALLGLASGRLADIAAWAEALHGTRVTVFTDPEQTTITVIGRTSTGPVIAVYDTVSDWPLETRFGERDITAEELATVAADVRSAESLAGVR